MAKKPSYLSDTAALVGPTLTGDRTQESSSISTRKIDNGYIISTSSCKDGRYESSEVYSKDAPGATQPAPENLMARAVQYMKSNSTI
jgi:AICAR transformylase/IMP cyclohydrolase PurH